MNTITYKGKEYQEVIEERWPSCKGCAFTDTIDEKCTVYEEFPWERCSDNDFIYKEIIRPAKKEAPQKFSLTKSELTLLINYHKDKMRYAWDCMETQQDIANTEPLYTFGSKQTKKDWEDSAKEWDKKVQYHEDRANDLIIIKGGI